MVKPKHNVVVEVLTEVSLPLVVVWCDASEEIVEALEAINGVYSVLVERENQRVSFRVSPRYDVHKVAAEAGGVVGLLCVAAREVVNLGLTPDLADAYKRLFLLTDQALGLEVEDFLAYVEGQEEGDPGSVPPDLALAADVAAATVVFQGVLMKMVEEGEDEDHQDAV